MEAFLKFIAFHGVSLKIIVENMSYEKVLKVVKVQTQVTLRGQFLLPIFCLLKEF